MIKLSSLKPLENNPFKKKDDDQIKKIGESIKSFERMMSIRKIIIDENNEILGGNKRFFALKKLGYKEIPDEWVDQVIDLTEEQKKEFIVKDNSHWGSEWDYEMLKDWGVDLDAWGVDGELIDRELTETEKLSKLEFESVYYEPENKPEVALADCLDLSIFNEKVKAIEDSNLTDEQKSVLKMFSYRFIRIDFENVANYYYFNAGDEEKKIIERLRLVLCDGGIDGFIEDDILMLHGLIDGWNEEND